MACSPVMGIKMFLNNGLIRIITRTTINYNKHNWLYRFPVWVRETQNKDFKWVMVSFRFWIDSDALVKYGCNSTSLTNWRLTSVFTCVCVCLCVQVITPCRRLILCADNRKEMEEWMAALRSVQNRQNYEVCVIPVRPVWPVSPSMSC